MGAPAARRPPRQRRLGRPCWRPAGGRGPCTRPTSVRALRPTPAQARGCAAPRRARHPPPTTPSPRRRTRPLPRRDGGRWRPSRAPRRHQARCSDAGPHGAAPARQHRQQALARARGLVGVSRPERRESPPRHAGRVAQPVLENELNPLRERHDAIPQPRVRRCDAGRRGGSRPRPTQQPCPAPTVESHSGWPPATARPTPRHGPTRAVLAPRAPRRASSQRSASSAMPAGSRSHHG